MRDLDRRFREADRIPTRDLWADIATREPARPLSPSPFRRVAIAAVALVVVAAAIAFVAWAFVHRQKVPVSPPPHMNGKIAFVGTSNIFTMNPDGSGTRQITHLSKGFAYTGVAWSPDGSMLAAIEAPTTSPSTRYAIVVMRPDGTSVRSILTIRDCAAKFCLNGAPTWSPDESRLAFAMTRSDQQPSRIAVIDVDGSHLHTLANSDGQLEPAWSPDGTQIAVVGSTGLSVIDADGNTRRRLDDCGADHPAWSPDGTQIVFGCIARETGQTLGLYVIDATRGRAKLLYQPNPDGPITSGEVTQALDPTWSPDGATILFAQETADGNPPVARWDLYTIRTDGTDLRRVTRTSLTPTVPAPSWQSLPG